MIQSNHFCFCFVFRLTTTEPCSCVTISPRARDPPPLRGVSHVVYWKRGAEAEWSLLDGLSVWASVWVSFFSFFLCALILELKLMLMRVPLRFNHLVYQCDTLLDYTGTYDTDWSKGSSTSEFIIITR